MIDQRKLAHAIRRLQILGMTEPAARVRALRLAREYGRPVIVAESTQDAELGEREYPGDMSSADAAAAYAAACPADTRATDRHRVRVWRRYAVWSVSIDDYAARVIHVIVRPPVAPPCDRQCGPECADCRMRPDADGHRYAIAAPWDSGTEIYQRECCACCGQRRTTITGRHGNGVDCRYEDPA
jgi:hypothetical protein